MIRKIWPLMVVLSAVAMLSSCLGNDDDDVDNSYTYYNDAGIVSFSLGTMKQYRDTVAKDGSDSTYFVHITQLGPHLYQASSLRHVGNQQGQSGPLRCHRLARPAPAPRLPLLVA